MKKDAKHGEGFNKQSENISASSRGVSNLFLSKFSQLRKNIYVSVRRLSLFSRRRSTSIVDRILGLLLIWGFLVYLLSIAGIWWGSTKVIEDNFNNQAAEWIRKLDELGTPLYASDDKSLFGSIENHVSRFPVISYLRYYESDNNTVIAEYYSEKIHRENIPVLTLLQIEKIRLNVESDKPLFLHSADSDLSLVQAATPIVIRSIQSDGMIGIDLDLTKKQSEFYKIIGFIELGLDFGMYRAQLIKNISLGSIVIAGLFMLAALVGRMIIKKSLRPLTNLRKPLIKLAKGDIDVHVKSEGDDEIVAIANALNTTIKALKGRDKELRQLANYDSLTGLLNKSNFNILLEKELERTVEDNDTSAVLFIDLDQFKYINDNLGHAAGDRLLVQIAELLKSRMRRDDIISRFGGDEFTVIASSVSESDARLIASSILKSMQDFVFFENDQSFNIYCSIGVVMMNANTFSAEEIFSQADMACFHAKSAGRNQYYMFDVMEQEETRKVADISWSKSIKEAIDDDKFLLYFQPVIPLSGQSDLCYEVLLRMVFNDEVICPNVFLPAAKRLGMMVDIDFWVIRNAFKVNSELALSGQKIIFSINLSSKVLKEPGFVGQLKKYFKEYDVNPASVVFEITEKTIVKNIELTNKIVDELVSMGCRFALDDFGTRSGSSSYLKNLPVEYFKIDGNFVTNMAGDLVGQEMVQSMIKIAQILNKKVIVKHVQDKYALQLLKSFGADFVQGYYLAMPEPTLSQEKLQTAMDLVNTADSSSSS